MVQGAAGREAARLGPGSHLRPWYPVAAKGGCSQLAAVEQSQQKAWLAQRSERCTWSSARDRASSPLLTSWSTRRCTLSSARRACSQPCARPDEQIESHEAPADVAWPRRRAPRVLSTAHVMPSQHHAKHQAGQRHVRRFRRQAPVQAADGLGTAARPGAHLCPVCVPWPAAGRAADSRVKQHNLGRTFALSASVGCASVLRRAASRLAAKAARSAERLLSSWW